MPRKRKVNLDEFLAQHPVFTRAEVAAFCPELDGGPDGQLTRFIDNEVRAGRMFAVRKRLYAARLPGVAVDDTPIDPCLVAAKLSHDSVLTCHSALLHYGFADTPLERIPYLCDVSCWRYTFRSWEFVPVCSPQILLRQGQRDFGVVDEVRTGVSVRVTSLERTLVDVLDRPHEAGGWEAAYRGLESMPPLDLDVALAYVALLGNRFVAAKVGFFLEQHQAQFAPTDDHLAQLRSLLPTRLHVLEGFSSSRHYLVPAWNLSVPEPIMHRTWEVPQQYLRKPTELEQLVHSASTEPRRQVVAPAVIQPKPATATPVIVEGALATPADLGDEGFFTRHPVFTRAEFEAFHEGIEPLDKPRLDEKLKLYRKAGRLLRVHYNLWIAVPRGHSPKTAPIDPLLLPGKACEDGVLAYHAALELHGLARSAQPVVSYFSKRLARIWSFREYEFRPSGWPLALRREGSEESGVVTVERAGMPVRATSLARTFVDVLHRPDLGGGWEEVWHALQAIDALEVDEVVDYALLLGKQTTVSKVGFFLEQRAEALGVSEQHLDRLQKHCVSTWTKIRGFPLAPHVPSSRWRIGVPAPLVTGDWESVAAEFSAEEEAGGEGLPVIPFEQGQVALVPGQRNRRVWYKAQSGEPPQPLLPEPLAAAAEEFLGEHSIFTRQELREYCAVRGVGGEADTNRLLKWGEERGRLVMVQRPVWAVVPEGVRPEELEVNPVLLAEKVGARARHHPRRIGQQLVKLVEQARAAGIDARELDVESFFAAHPVFTRQELSDYCRRRGLTASRQVDLLLAVCRETGQLEWLNGFLWAYVPQGDQAGTQPPDPLLVAAKAAPDAVLCYHSALALHGWASSQPERLTYLTEEGEEEWRLGEVEFKPVLTPRALWGSGHDDFGISTVERSGVPIRVTSPERTFVDALDQPKLSGGWEEICHALAQPQGLDLNAVVDYALWLGDPLTIGKVGYFLDRRKQEWGFGQGPFKRLRWRRPQAMKRIPGFGDVRHIPIRPWHLEVPYAIHYNLWAEEDRAAERKGETSTQSPAAAPVPSRPGRRAKATAAGERPADSIAIEFLASHPVFTSAEFHAHLRRQVSLSAEESHKLLVYLSGRRRVFCVAREIWAAVHEGFLPIDSPVDPFLIPGRLAVDEGILAYHTALALHGHAFSEFPSYHYQSSAKVPQAWSWRGYLFQPVHPPHILKTRHAEDVAVVTVERSGLPVRVTSLERTLVDVLTRIDLVGGWAEAGRSLDTIPSLDVDAVVEYALLLDNKVTAAKVGWYLEHHPHTWGVERDHLNRLRAQAPNQWYHLPEFSGVEHERVDGWHLKMPPALASGSWDEVARLTAQIQEKRVKGRRKLPAAAPPTTRARPARVWPTSPLYETGEKYVGTHPIFTTHALRAYCQEQGEATTTEVNAILTRYQRNGKVLLVRRPVWAAVPPGVPPEEVPVDPLLVAAHAREDACLAHHAALQVHGYARSEPQYYAYVTALPSCPRWYFRSYTFLPLRPPGGLIKRGAEQTSMTMLERAGVPIRVTTPERTFVDVLMHPEWAGGWEEAWRALTRIESLDLDEVVRYVSLLDHPTTASKVGYFLESHQRELGVSDGQLDELRRNRPLHPCNAKGGPEYRLVAVPGWKMSLPYPAVFGEWEERPKTPRARRVKAAGVSG